MLTPEQLSNPDNETSEQKAIFAWAALNVGKYPMLKWLHAIPNGNSHRMVAEGVRAGVNDIFLPWPKFESEACVNASCAGIYIELKIEKRRNQKDGGCSKAQLEFQEYVKSVGYCAKVCYGWKEAVIAIEEYLE